MQEKDLDDPLLEMIDTADSSGKMQPLLSPLHRAAFAGDLDQVRLLLEGNGEGERKANPLDKDVNNDTLLHLVAEWGELEVLQYLIEEVGCNPVTKGWNGATVLHRAAETKQLPVVKYLVEHCKMDPTNEPDDVGESPLVHACRGGDLEIVRYFVQHSQEMTTSMEDILYLEHNNIKDNLTDRNIYLHYYRTEPLSCACFYGHLPIVKYLVKECGCDPLRKEGELKAPLESAVLQGHMHIVQYLASTDRVRNDSRYQHELCLVFYATLRSDVAMATYLVQTLHCNPNVPYNDLAPLHEAVLRNDLHMTKKLLEDLGCDLNPRGRHGQKMIHYGAAKGEVNMLKYLVEKQGCSPSATDDRGETPLLLAVKLGHFNAVHYLVKEQRCSPTCRGGGELSSPIYLAAFQGHLDIFRFFMMELKCCPNARNFKGNTLLHVASQGGSIPVIQYLIHKLGADKNALNFEGRTPLSVAARVGKIPVVLHLLEKERCEVRDSLSFTPLHYASGGGHLDLVKHLVQSHPHLCVLKDTFEFSPLIPACATEQLAVLQYLVEAGGCDPTSVVDSHGNSLVHYAAFKGNVNILHYLIHHHTCNHMRRNVSGNTPLHLAAMQSKMEVVKFLCERSVECVFIENYLGLTPLQVALQYGSHSTALYLIVKMFYNFDLYILLLCSKYISNTLHI